MRTIRFTGNLSTIFPFIGKAFHSLLLKKLNGSGFTNGNVDVSVDVVVVCFVVVVEDEDVDGEVVVAVDSTTLFEKGSSPASFLRLMTTITPIVEPTTMQTNNKKQIQNIGF